jgi:hypothetical protein
MIDGGKLTDTENIKKYLFAGKSTITIQSTETGKHYTYKVKKHKEKDMFFVSVLSGSNNESDYIYMATIFEGGKLRLTKKSRANESTTSYIAFNWFYRNLLFHDENINMLNVYHNGTCGRCGRKLTTPESIEYGLGPTCRNK